MSQRYNRNYKRGFLIVALLYMVFFELQYVFVYSYRFYYIGSFQDLNYNKILLSHICAITILMVAYYVLRNDAFFVFSLFCIISIIPTISVYGLKNENTEAFLLICLYWIVWVISMYVFFQNACNEKKDGEKSGEICYHSAVFYGLFLLCVFVILYIAMSNSELRLFITLDEIYDYRNKNNIHTDGIWAYLFYWCSNLFLPVCIIRFTLKKEYILIFVGVIITFIGYSIHGNKIILAEMIIAFCICFMVKKNIESLLPKIMMIISCSIMAIRVLLTRTGADMSIIDSLGYRGLSVPAEAHYYYFDFFSSNERLFLRQSILRRWLSAPYKTSVSEIIGSSSKYYVKVGDYQNMNNGLFSDAYQNFGVIGVVVFPILIAITLSVLYRTVSTFEREYLLFVMIEAILYLFSGYFFAWLLTGGVLVYILLFSAAYKKHMVENEKNTGSAK